MAYLLFWLSTSNGLILKAPNKFQRSQTVVIPFLGHVPGHVLGHVLGHSRGNSRGHSRGKEPRPGLI